MDKHLFVMQKLTRQKHLTCPVFVGLKPVLYRPIQVEVAAELAVVPEVENVTFLAIEPVMAAAAVVGLQALKKVEDNFNDT
jgi:hypothetical protein